MCMLKKIYITSGSLILLGLLAVFSGCSTTGLDSHQMANATNMVPPAVILTENSADLLRPGDLIVVVFSGVEDPPEKHTETIRDDGTIRLQYLKEPIKAAGKKPRELQEEIWRKYVVEEKLFREHLSVTVQTEMRYFYVQGEVKMSNRYPYAGEVTILKAIAAAGGFTDFANKKKVELIRANGTKITINALKAQKDPQLDLPVYPGDQIFVPRRLW